MREAADVRLMGQVASLKNVPLRENAPVKKRVVVIGGCIGQRDGEDLIKKLSHVDVVFGTFNLASLPRLIEQALLTGDHEVEVLSEATDFPTDLPTERESKCLPGFLFQSDAIIFAPTASFPTFAVERSLVLWKTLLPMPNR